MHVKVLPQLVAVMSCTLFALSDGISFGWTSPFIPYLESNCSHIPATKSQLEWLETNILLGSLFVLPLTNYLVDSIGRKKCLLLAGFMEMTSWFLMAVATKIELLLATRLLFGVACNMLFVTAPMYVAEIADVNYRGILSNMINIMELLGNVIVYSVGPYCSFAIPCIIGSCVCLIGFVVFSTVPESPWHLLNKNNEEGAKRSLKYFQSYLDVDEEIKLMSNALEQQKSEKGRLKDLFLVSSNRKAVITVTLLNGGQQFGAYSVVLMNMHFILESAGSIYMDSASSAILFAVLMLIAAIVASSQIDRYGRRILVIVSSILTGSCLLTLAIYFHLKLLGCDMFAVSWIPIASVMVYAAVFKIGLGIVPMVITGELFPANVKAFGMTVSDATFVLGGIASIQLYQLLKSFGLYMPFYIFSACSFFLAIFGYLWMPETKGKSLDEIQNILKERKK